MFNRIRHMSAGFLIVTGLLFGANAALANIEDSPFKNLESTRVHGTIVDVAVGNPQFSTLVAALTAADLVTTLQGKGPFTVFAPTNAAFSKIPAPILNYLLSNPAALKQVLLYHVAPGVKELGFAFFPQVIGTVQGQKVFARIALKGNVATLSVNNSSVILRPIRTDNGIIYVIDSVLQPQFR